MLPSFKNDDRTFQLMQDSWRAQLNPLLAKPIVNGVFVKSVSLINGVTVINHLLEQKMQGWIATDINGAATIYRSAPLNDKTISITSNAAVIADFWFF